MICPKCLNSGELKEFSTFKYYYCGTCKEEINLEILEAMEKAAEENQANFGIPMTAEELREEFDRLVREIPAFYTDGDDV